MGTAEWYWCLSFPLVLCFGESWEDGEQQAVNWGLI